MAGTYADVPAPRIAYDLIDVDVLSHLTITTQPISSVDDTIPRNLSSTVVQRMNSDGADSGSSASVVLTTLSTNNITFIFRELYDITAYYLISSSSDVDFGTESIYASTDTTNGIDGAWSLAAGTVTINAYSTRAVFRPPTSLTATSIKALQFRFSNPGGSDAIGRLHLYGNPTVSPAPTRTQRIAFYDATTDVEFTGANLDLGDVALSSSFTKSFRIRNYSPASTVRNITLSVNQLNSPVSGPSLPAQYLLSLDGLTYTATVNIPYLYSGEYSNVIYVRKETPYNATAGMWTARIEASAEDWF